MTATGRQIVQATLIDGLGKRISTAVRLTLSEAIALGKIEGAKVLHLTGRRLDVNTEAEAWEGVAAAPYRQVIPADMASWAAASEPLTAVSTSGDDTFMGAGAQVLLVEYINAAGWERVGVAVMQGATPVSVFEARVDGVGNASALDISTIPATALRVNRVTVVTGTVAVGVITVSMTGGIVQHLPIGRALSMASRITVPRGMIGLVSGFGYGTDLELRGTVNVYAQPLGKPNYLFQSFEASAGALAVPIVHVIRVAPLGEFGLTFVKAGGGSNINVSSVLQTALIPDPSDLDPTPGLQPAPLG